MQNFLSHHIVVTDFLNETQMPRQFCLVIGLELYLLVLGSDKQVWFQSIFLISFFVYDKGKLLTFFVKVFFIFAINVVFTIIKYKG